MLRRSLAAIEDVNGSTTDSQRFTVYSSSFEVDNAGESKKPYSAALLKLPGRRKVFTRSGLGTIPKRLLSLACVYDAQRQYEDAQQLLVRALAGRQVTLGLDHSNTQLTVQLLESVYRKLGLFDKAKMLEKYFSPPPRAP